MAFSIIVFDRIVNDPWICDEGPDTELCPLSAPTRVEDGGRLDDDPIERPGTHLRSRPRYRGATTRVPRLRCVARPTSLPSDCVSLEFIPRKLITAGFSQRQNVSASAILWSFKHCGSGGFGQQYIAIVPTQLTCTCVFVRNHKTPPRLIFYPGKSSDFDCYFDDTVFENILQECSHTIDWTKSQISLVRFM